MEKDGRTQSEKVRFKRRQLLHFKGYDEVASETSEIKEKRSCMTGGLSSLMEKQLQNVLRKEQIFCIAGLEKQPMSLENKVMNGGWRWK